MAKVIKLFIAPANEEGRAEQNEIMLDEKGVVGDKFYNKKIDRSVLITGTFAYELAKKNSINLEYGNLGENILIDFDTSEINENYSVKIGEAILKVTKRCTICNHLSIYDEKLPMLVKELRGVYLEVIEGGKIKVGDQVYMENN